MYKQVQNTCHGIIQEFLDVKFSGPTVSKRTNQLMTIPFCKKAVNPEQRGGSHRVPPSHVTQEEGHERNDAER